MVVVVVNPNQSTHVPWVCITFGTSEYMNAFSNKWAQNMVFKGGASAAAAFERSDLSAPWQGNGKKSFMFQQHHCAYWAWHGDLLQKACEWIQTHAFECGLRACASIVVVYLDLDFRFEQNFHETINSWWNYIFCESTFLSFMVGEWSFKSRSVRSFTSPHVLDMIRTHWSMFRREVLSEEQWQTILSHPQLLGGCLAFRFNVNGPNQSLDKYLTIYKSMCENHTLISGGQHRRQHRHNQSLWSLLMLHPEDDHEKQIITDPSQCGSRDPLLYMRISEGTDASNLWRQCILYRSPNVSFTWNTIQKLDALRKSRPLRGQIPLQELLNMS